MIPNQFAIDMLLDEVLLEIFACYVEESQERDAWHTLACVCRRWRSIAFGSPRRLNLRVFCSDIKRVKKKLDSWPPFPIVLTSIHNFLYEKLREQNILATLKHHDHICQIKIRDFGWLWEKVLPLMQKPFPILTDLSLGCAPDMEPVVSDLFLGHGESATRLRKLELGGIPFPGLPKLLLSTTNLVHLELYDIPDSGYIAPDAMVTCLSALTKLQFLGLNFDLPPYHPEWERRCTPSHIRALLPSLTSFAYKGVLEYLEDIIDSIDAPQLDRLTISIIYYQSIPNTSRRLAHFISHVPKLKTCNEARMRLCTNSGYEAVQIVSLSKTTTNASLLLEYRRRTWQRGFQLSTLVQLCRVCTSSLPQVLIHMVECLLIVIVGSNFSSSCRQYPSVLRELLQPFTAVKDLYLSQPSEYAPRHGIALVLQEIVEERVLELLPVLQNIFWEDPQPWGLVPEGVEQFVAAQQLASRPISVSRWEIDRKVLTRFSMCHAHHD